MEETPVAVLFKRIDFYHSVINRLRTKEGIDKDTPQDKLDKMILKYEQKIKEFESAIKILDPNAKSKSDKCVSVRIDNELKQNVEGIHRLKVENELACQFDVTKQSELLVHFSENVIWKEHRIHISTKAIQDYLKSNNSL